MVDGPGYAGTGSVRRLNVVGRLTEKGIGPVFPGWLSNGTLLADFRPRRVWRHLGGKGFRRLHAWRAVSRRLVTCRAGLLHLTSCQCGRAGHCLAQETVPPTQADQAAAHRTTGFTIVPSKVRNRLVIRLQALEQPHLFHVTLTLAFESSRRANLCR